MRPVRREAAPSRPAPAEEQGFIVLGLLVTILLLLAGGVMLGKVVHHARYPHEVRLDARELRYAVREVEVRYGALPTARIPARDSAWVRPVGGGEVAVFVGPESQKIVGFAPDTLLRRDRRLAFHADSD
jgi:hypothetical protein